MTQSIQPFIPTRRLNTAMLCFLMLLAACAAEPGNPPLPPDYIPYGAPVLDSWPGPGLHVRANAPAGGDGSAAAPFRSIQAAIDAASGAGLIRVAGGTYQERLVLPDDRPILLVGAYDAAYASRSLAMHPSRIEGHAAYPVISLPFAASGGVSLSNTIDGFTIRGGQRGIEVDNVGNGGRLFITILNTRVDGNGGLAGGNDYGGGIRLTGVAARVAWNLIRRNSCGKGGALSLQLEDPTERFLLEHNIFSGNAGRSDHGGGVYISARSGVIAHNLFEANRIEEAWGWGGGMIIDGNRYDSYNDSLVIVLSNNIYRANTSPSPGSAFFVDEGANVRAYHELVVANTNTGNGQGGAVYVDGPAKTPAARTLLVHCTIADNHGSGEAGHGLFAEDDAQVFLTNSILWGNRGSGTDTSQCLTAGASSITIGYSILEGSWPGTGVLATDPLFAGAGDYHLRSTVGRWNGKAWVQDAAHSPGIDAGDPGSPWSRETAPHGSRANLGTYGNTAEASRSAY
jgi:hypothetical protein